MTFRYDDRVKVTVASALGTSSPIPYNSPALTGFLPFTSINGITTADIVPYSMWDGAGNWEDGYGTWTAGTGLARTTVTRNSAGTTANINFTNPVTAYVSAHKAALGLIDNNGLMSLSGVTIKTSTSLNSEFDGIVAINTSTGANATAVLNANNGTSGMTLAMFGTGATQAGANYPNGGQLVCGGSGGISYVLGGSGSNCIHRFYPAGSSTPSASIGAAGISAAGYSLNLDNGSGASLVLTGFGETLNVQSSQISCSGTLSIVAGGSGGTQLLPGATNFTPISDERAKDGLEAIDPEQALADVLAWRTETGYLKADASKRQRLFLIAQNVRENTPEMVFEDDKGVMHVDYDMAIPKIVAAIKALAARG